ncbi:prepilin peptidase [Myxococcota bacterium]|nr:prepilin peptidase [Myxococcota bacterium]
MSPFDVFVRHPELAASPALPVLTFVLGAMVGSFLNVVIARLPVGESIVHPRSHCPRCGDMIPSWLNVPILSWIALRGRCRACKLPISIRYPIVELLTAILFLASLARFGPSPAALVAAGLSASLVAITFIDIDWWEIPDEITRPAVYLGIVLRPLVFGGPWWGGLVGAATGAAIIGLVAAAYVLYKRREGMGLGDVKLLAMIGAFLGPSALLVVMLVASILGSVIGGIALLAKRVADRSSARDATPADTGADGAPADEDEDEEEVTLRPVAILAGIVEFLAGERLARRLFPRTLAEDDAPGAPGADGTGDAAEDDWVPPRHALPFGPFLALGALAQLFLGPAISRMLFGGLS